MQWSFLHKALQAAYMRKSNSRLSSVVRSRAMQFDFTPRKGSGISRLLPSCPAPALSLLYQMLAYDPDERISAETALRHTYFREIRWSAFLEEMGGKKTKNFLHLWSFKTDRQSCHCSDLLRFDRFWEEIWLFSWCRMGDKNSDTLQRVSENLVGMQRSSQPVWRPPRPGKQLRGRHHRLTPLINVSENSAGQPDKWLKTA